MYFAIVLLLLVIILVILANPFKTAYYIDVKIGDTKVNAEVADTFAKKVKGLMFRKNLSEKEGMIFPFDEEGYQGIWMMNMSIPIDIIWMDKDKKVVDVVKDAQPCGLSCGSYTPKEKAMYVLEVKANFTERHGVKIGSKATFKLV